MLAGSLFLFIRTRRRFALNSALSAIASAFFVLAFLDALPIEDADTLACFLAQVASAVSAVLAYLLFSILGLLRQRAVRHRTVLALAALVAAVVVCSWLIPPKQALVMGLAMVCTLGVSALLVSLWSVVRGDRMARVAVTGVSFMLAALAGLAWIALDRSQVPWPVHAFSAVSGTFYLVAMSALLWMRYAYLVELQRAMAHGPHYDPVTRMLSHSGTAEMVGAAFKRYREAPEPLGVIVVSIANFPVLEKLYGPSAVNHALFIFAGRLRRDVPEHIDIGRLAGDGFLLVMRHCHDRGPLLLLARKVQACLAKPVSLRTVVASKGEGAPSAVWAAEVGLGVQLVSRTDARASTAVAMGRGMSRTAWSYPGRVAWYDDSRREIVGMPEFSP